MTWGERADWGGRHLGEVRLLPDWVIVGVPNLGNQPGVGVMASRTLTGAVVTATGRRTPINVRRGIEPYAIGVVYQMTTAMEDIRMCWGETYADALAALLKDWGPYERQEAMETAPPGAPELTP